MLALKVVLYYSASVFIVLPYLTALLAANDQATQVSEGHKGDYPYKIMRVLFFLGIILLLAAIFLSVKY